MKTETLQEFIAKFPMKKDAAKALGIDNRNLPFYEKMGKHAVVVEGELFIKQGRRNK